MKEKQQTLEATTRGQHIPYSVFHVKADEFLGWPEMLVALYVYSVSYSKHLLFSLCCVISL